jgi:D-3-phosphoglycerate dehydrogenase
MDGLRILIAEPENYAAEALAVYQALGTIELGPLTRAELLERLPEAQVLVVRLAHQIDAQALEQAAKLRAIVSPTTGLDHIDLDAAARRGVTVLSLKGETVFLRSIPATAELTWGLLLALTRHIPQAHESVLRGEWDRDRFKGHDLAGQTLGILGLGRIGEKVARYADAFGMRVIACDPYRAEWPAGVERAAGLADLLAQSEILSLHVPLNAETHRMIGTAELNLLPRGALLINTARGDVLDELALLAALESGQLGGAALDVIWNERAGGGTRLAEYARRHANLILTPHIGGATVESMAATEVFMARKLRDGLKR